MNIWILISFVCYMLGMFLVGAGAAKKNKSSDDYFLGGRNLNGWVAALSAQASDMSGWLLMGLPGSIYAFGVCKAWVAIGLFIGTVANWLLISGRLRRYSIKINAMTIPEYLNNRFRDKRNILMTISAIVIVIFFLVYTASALKSGGMLFVKVFEEKITYHQALIIGSVVILGYTFLGGFIAVCKTDFIQGTLMLIGILTVPVVAVMLMGSGHIIPNLLDSGIATSAGDAMSTTEFLNVFSKDGRPIKFVEVISDLAWGLGYCGMPHILVRFMAIRDDKELAKSRRVAIVWVLMSLAVACIIGVIGRAYLFPDVLTGTNTEDVFINMIKKVFIDETNLAIIGGIFLCGILAAIMSTADSQLLVSSSAVANDLCKKVFFTKLSEKTVLLIARITVLVIAGLAIIIAWNPDSSIMDLVSDAWAGLGAAFGPTIFMSLFWKKTNLAGAASGMISGAATVIIWDYFKFLNKDGVKVTLYEYTEIYSLLVGFFISLAFIVLVTIATKKVDSEIEEEFMAVKNKID